jgi:hypothetical protein
VATAVRGRGGRKPVIPEQAANRDASYKASEVLTARDGITGRWPVLRGKRKNFLALGSWCAKRGGLRKRAKTDARTI